CGELCRGFSRLSFFSHVAKDQDNALHRPLIAIYRGPAIIDRDFVAISGDENCVVRQSHDMLQAAHFLDGILNGLACLLIDDPEHLAQWLAFGFCLWPSS